MKEIDLYNPIKRFLESQGYEVKGEIGECDIMAVRGTENPVVVELKLAFSLDVLLQAVNRLSIYRLFTLGFPLPAGLSGSAATVSSNFSGCWESA